MDREAWRATVHGVAESRTGLRLTLKKAHRKKNKKIKASKSQCLTSHKMRETHKENA